MRLRKRSNIFKYQVHPPGSDTELACWAQLRLLGAVAEFNGVQGAIARLGEVRQALTRFGDARPFAALHLGLLKQNARAVIY